MSTMRCAWLLLTGAPVRGLHPVPAGLALDGLWAVTIEAFAFKTEGCRGHVARLLGDGCEHTCCKCMPRPWKRLPSSAWQHFYRALGA